MIRKKYLLLISFLLFSCSDNDPIPGETTPLRPDLPSQSTFLPLDSVSDIKIEFDKLIYNEGDRVNIRLEFLGSAFPTTLPGIVLSSTDSGDVEFVKLKKRSDTLYESQSPILINAKDGESNNNVFSTTEGEPFFAFYVPDKKAGLETIQEDLIFDFAFLASNRSENIGEINPDFSISDDEETNPKAIATLVTKAGAIQVPTQEVIFYPKNDHDLNTFLERSGGSLLRTFEDPEDKNKKSVLIKVDPSTLDPQNLSLLRRFFDESDTLYTSKEAGLLIYQFVLFYRLEGFALTLNPRLLAHHSPRISTRESANLSKAMKLEGAFDAPCLPNDPTQRCLFNVPAIWAFNELWDIDTKIPVAVLDMGFATHNDFRPPDEGNMIECDMTSNIDCGPGKAQGVPTVGSSGIGEKKWHGTAVVSIIGGVVNNGFARAGVAGQLVEPMLYKFDLGSYAFETGVGIAQAVFDGAACINISAGYPCRLLTNVGSYDVCSIEGRLGICSVISAAAFAAAGTTCAATSWLDFFLPGAGSSLCAFAAGGATTASAACFTTLFAGNLRSPIEHSVNFATRSGVPIVASAGNDIISTLDPILQEIVDGTDNRLESWQIVPAVIPNVIAVGAADPGNLANRQFYGDRVDIWAPIDISYVAPSSTSDPTSALVLKPGFRGTSAAAPYITGVIANMQAANPQLNPTNPALATTQKAAIVANIRQILLNPDNNFTNQDLVNLGYSSQALRRLLVNPFKVVQAAALGVPLLTDFDMAYNFDERSRPDDLPAQARNLDGQNPIAGTILTQNPIENMTLGPDQDWFRFSPPSSGLTMGRLYETKIVFNFPADKNNDELAVAGGPEIQRNDEGGRSIFTSSDDPVLFKVQGATAESDNVYNLHVEETLEVPIHSRILAPANGIRYCAGSNIQFSAVVKYQGLQSGSLISNDDIFWRNPANGFILGHGRDFTQSFSAGRYGIELRVFTQTTDAPNFEILVEDCSDHAPALSIFKPAMNITTQEQDYVLTEFDNTKMMFYREVELIASGTDIEDGNLPDSAFEWRTDQSTLQDVILGTGKTITVRLYSRSGLTTHTIRATVTDSDGNQTTRVRTILLWRFI